ncbi:MAG: HAMP domain-containing histidine kinase [Candidatus Obscuribacterales bacterium]|nr:HAMP domain-containing histidine kinase [Candidatus Obscuribacterales bacterium]
MKKIREEIMHFLSLLKLRHTLLLLVTLPLMSQLITVGLLAHQNSKVDTNVRKEIVAKKVVALTQEINALLSREMVEVTGTKMMVKSQRDHSAEETMRDMLTKVKELRLLVNDNPSASVTAERLERNCQRFIDYWNEFWRTIIVGFDLAQFLEESEFLESFKVLYDEIHIDSAKLIDMYATVAEEFQPMALQQREANTQVLLYSVMVVLLVFFLSLAIVYKFALTRLAVLMRNIEKFSKGEKQLDVLSGADEFALLDQAFRDMSQERNRLEEIRKSMRAMVSHDLRSPLTSINIRLDLMTEKYRDNAEIYKQLKIMYSESQRLVRLASTLLDIEKIEEGLIELNLKSIECETLVAHAVASIETLAERKSINLVETITDFEGLRCDEDRIVQVMVNLLSNAIKFAPAKSTIEIKADSLDEGVVRFEILDEGPGIPLNKINNLFSKFLQLDQPSDVKKEGSGLGLYICKMLVHSHGGTIGCSNRDTGGSCFWFELPIEPIVQTQGSSNDDSVD